MQTAKLALIVLCFLTVACFSAKSAAAPQSGQQEENLTFPDEDHPPPSENLAFPDEDLASAEDNVEGFQFSPSENISVKPLDIPSTDFSQAPIETEPNENAETASVLGAVSTGTAGASFAAHGNLSGRDDDYFYFSVTGEAQLYLIEAVGPGVNRLALYEAAGKLASGKDRADGAGQTIAGIYLAPGDYHAVVEHFRDDGDTMYTIRATSMGVPDRHSELEPNDVAADAELLVTGVPRTGLFLAPDDVDYYRFSLWAEQLVRIRIEPPPEVTLSFSLEEEKRSLLSRTSGEPGEAVEYTALFQPGNYYVVVNPKKGASATPYLISLDTANRFQTQVDLEPNDHPSQARPVPANGVISGRSRDFGDYDWYRLPQITTATVLTVHSEAGSQRLLLNRPLAGEKTERIKLVWSKEKNTFSANLEAGEQYLLEVGVRGDYVFRVELNPRPAGYPPSGTGRILDGIRLQVTRSLPSFAAFWRESQTANFPLSISNEGSEVVRLSLDIATSHPGWHMKETGKPVEVGPGQTVNVPLVLEVAPDVPADMPVRIDFRVRDESGASAIGSTSAIAACGADPAGPGSIWTMPDNLVGGFNVAWSGLGSHVVEASDDSYGASQADLYDGLTPNDHGWGRVGPYYPLDLTVQLAGDQDIPVTGIILNPQGKTREGDQPRDFELYLSADGTEYNRVLSGSLTRGRIPQHFVLPQPTMARFARLRILSNFTPATNRIGLGEFAVVADPAANPFPDQRLNLADPAHGGFVAWSQPRFQHYQKAAGMLTEEVEQPTLKVDPVLPTEWVIGFHHNRAAQISELQWVDSPGVPKLPKFNSVKVSVSIDGAAGPWETVGIWSLDHKTGSPAPLVLDEPVWARFVRFVSTEAETVGLWEAAETIRILERGVDNEYRSILAEWGQYSAAAVYEWTLESSVPSLREAVHAGENNRKDTALQMSASINYADRVERGKRVAWYRFDVPTDHNRLRFTVFGNPVANVSATLEDEAGTLLPLMEISDKESELVLESVLNGGKTYWLRLEEPRRYVVMTWDNSGSVRPYRAQIYSAIGDFIRDIQPGNEFVQLLPFSSGGFLLDDWSDQTGALMAGLQSYARKDDDSNAETYMLMATSSLSVQKGARAIVIVTDAATFSYDETPALWRSLSSVRPRVFAAELHEGDKTAYHQDLMQSWASVNNGNYAHFSQRNDLDVAFDRAFCHLRRPVRFDVVADSRFEEPPGPGSLAVNVENAISANAVELILDASGSMLQRLEGRRRIEIARAVLTKLVNETIPEGTPLALRVFGHRKPDACDTDLASPLQPLDRGKLTSVIQATQAMNLARTPIGDSLRLVADDLKGVDGQKLIILITDGEETCDGDPAAAITWLKESGHDLRVNVVGFAIDDEALRAEFEEWSRIGGGLYFNAGSATELDKALRQALRPKFQVLDDAGAIVANGTAGAEDLELPSSIYTVKILTSPIQTFNDVTIKPEETTRISAAGKD